MNPFTSTLIRPMVVAFLFALPYQWSAQTNLEYAETITLELSGTTSTNFSIATLNFTVPEGQTWKIESAMIARKSLSGGVKDYLVNNDLKLLLDDNLFFINGSNYSFQFPYWLKSGGHVLELLYLNTWSTTYTGKATLSVLVFNIIN
ncbi:MAG: hypothetical protein SH856_14215 [Flavobacteriales bacterium]|nr:hypothetical protein [Flavobacteriales bacterium]